MVGGGLEYVITSHWRARMQYQYVDLGDIDFHHRLGGSLGNFIGNSAASLRKHNVSFAISSQALPVVRARVHRRLKPFLQTHLGIDPNRIVPRDPLLDLTKAARPRN
jgi:hypothetical protein